MLHICVDLWTPLVPKCNSVRLLIRLLAVTYVDCTGNSVLPGAGRPSVSVRLPLVFIVICSELEIFLFGEFLRICSLHGFTW